MVAKGPEIRAAARRLVVEDGLTYRKAGAVLGISDAVIRVWAKQEGWPPKKPRRQLREECIQAAAKIGLHGKTEPAPPRNTPRAAKGEAGDSDASPRPKGFRPPDEKTIYGLVSTLDREILRSGNVKDMALSVIRFGFEELAAWPTPNNVAKLIELSIKLLQVPDEAQNPADVQEKIKLLEGRLAEMSKRAKPVATTFDDGEVPAVPASGDAD
jgi:hypothetical protein